jgi:hypothetical protein
MRISGLFRTSITGRLVERLVGRLIRWLVRR